MAKRRMFSIDVVGQDNFLDMPTDSRELYFQLGMYSDDEGFVSPKKVMRLTGSGDDSLKLLIAKGFIYTFESGIIIIRHWNQNNYIQSDRFAKTQFQLEKRHYQQVCIQDVSKMDTQGGREVKEVRKNTLSSKESNPTTMEGNVRDFRPDILKG